MTARFGLFLGWAAFVELVVWGLVNLQPTAAATSLADRELVDRGT